MLPLPERYSASLVSMFYVLISCILPWEMYPCILPLTGSQCQASPFPMRVHHPMVKSMKLTHGHGIQAQSDQATYSTFMLNIVQVELT